MGANPFEVNDQDMPVGLGGGYPAGGPNVGSVGDYFGRVGVGWLGGGGGGGMYVSGLGSRGRLCPWGPVVAKTNQKAEG